MSTTSQRRVDVRRLRLELAGEVIGPGDPTYESARRVFFPTIDKRPAAIVRPVDDAAVASVVAFARESGVELAVRSGGHSVAGHGASEGGIVLDLAWLDELQVDADARIASAETGLTAGRVTKALAAHDLAVPFGDTGSVGIGGLTLGGGVGYLVRKHGLTIDSLLSADVVTADGRVLLVDPSSHPDLFWAIRGGGGNFGVATRFRYRLHPLEGSTGGMLVLPATPETIASFVEAAAEAQDELSTIASVMPAPPMPFLPKEQHGRPILLAMLFHAGPSDEAQRVLAPFRTLAEPLADLLRPLSYDELYPPDNGESPPRATSRTLFVGAVDRTVAAEILGRLAASRAQMPVAQLRVLGGAMARVPTEATAFAHRRRRIMVNLVAVYANPNEAPVHEAWVGRFADSLREDDDAYVNFLGEEGPARVRASYPGRTWEQLRKVKRRYDPDNVFRVNHNIPPEDGRLREAA